MNTLLSLLASNLSNMLYHFLATQLIKNTITAKGYKIIVFLDLEWLYLWCCYQNLGIATHLHRLGINITEWPANWESSWVDPVWPHDVSNSFFSIFSNDILGALTLIYLTSIFLNPLPLIIITGFMILRQREKLFPLVPTHNCPTIPHISHIANIVNDKYDNCTWSRGIQNNPILIISLL